MSKAAMQQALNLLKSAYVSTALIWDRADCVESLEAALAQPEQGAVSHLWECIGRWSAYLFNNGEKANLSPPTWLVDAVKAATSQPEQEPVAKHICNLWINPETSFYEVDRCTHPINEVFPVYTAPPRKEWVGLTDEEINDFDKKLRDNGDYCSLHFAWGISAKLKEKNGG